MSPPRSKIKIQTIEVKNICFTALLNCLLKSKEIYRENCFPIYCGQCIISLKFYLPFCFLPLAVLCNNHILFELGWIHIAHKYTKMCLVIDRLFLCFRFRIFRGFAHVGFHHAMSWHCKHHKALTPSQWVESEWLASYCTLCTDPMLPPTVKVWSIHVKWCGCWQRMLHFSFVYASKTGQATTKTELAIYVIGHNNVCIFPFSSARVSSEILSKASLFSMNS